MVNVLDSACVRARARPTCERSEPSKLDDRDNASQAHDATVSLSFLRLAFSRRQDRKGKLSIYIQKIDSNPIFSLLYMLSKRRWNDNNACVHYLMWMGRETICAWVEERDREDDWLAMGRLD